MTNAPNSLLLVEDNPDDVALTLRAFKKHQLDHCVRVVSDGVEALDYLFDESHDLPQAVLLDIKLPRIDGLEVLKRLRAHPRTKHLAVIVLTSSLEQRDLLESYKLGANSYVRKPVDFVEFVGAASQLGLYWLMLNRAAPATA